MVPSSTICILAPSPNWCPFRIPVPIPAALRWRRFAALRHLSFSSCSSLAAITNVPWAARVWRSGFQDPRTHDLSRMMLSHAAISTSYVIVVCRDLDFSMLCGISSFWFPTFSACLFFSNQVWHLFVSLMSVLKMSSKCSKSLSLMSRINAADALLFVLRVPLFVSASSLMPHIEPFLSLRVLHVKARFPLFRDGLSQCFGNPPQGSPRPSCLCRSS